MAKHSSSIVEYLCWHEVRLLKLQCTSWLSPLFPPCTRVNPSLLSLDASVSRIVSSSWSNDLTIMLELSNCFICLKSSSCRSVHCQATIFCVSAVGVAVSELVGQPDEQPYLCDVRCPWKHLDIFQLFCPAKVVLLPMSSFFLEIVMLWWRHLSSNVFTSYPMFGKK